MKKINKTEFNKQFVKENNPYYDTTCTSLPILTPLQCNETTTCSNDDKLNWN